MAELSPSREENLREKTHPWQSEVIYEEENDELKSPVPPQISDWSLSSRSHSQPPLGRGKENAVMMVEEVDLPHQKLKDDEFEKATSVVSPVKPHHESLSRSRHHVSQTLRNPNDLLSVIEKYL